MSSLYDKAEKRLQRLRDTTYKQPLYRYPGQQYFYVFGFTKEGKKVFLGPYMAEAEANGKLAELQDGEIFPLDTRDANRATRIIKEVLLERSGDADEALKKVLHNKGYEREKKRRRRR